MNRFLTRVFLLPLLLCLAGVGGVYWWVAGEVAVDSSAERLLASDPRNQETFEKVDSLMPNTTLVLVALELDDLFSDRGARIVAETSNRMMEVEGAQEVKSLTHSGRPVRQGFGLMVEPFIPLRATEKEWDRIRAFTTDFPLSKNVMVSEDGRYAIFVGMYQREVPDHTARVAFRDEFMQAIDPIRSRVEAVHVLSFPFIEAEGVEAVASDLIRYLSIASVLIVAVLWITFRSLPAVGLVLTLEGIGVVLLVGIFHILGQAVDIYTGILFPLIGGLQLTFIVHYLAAIQRAYRSGCSPADAAGVAFREVIRPSGIAALTTMAGLLTLAFADLPTVNAFGRIGAVAVAVVFAATFLVPVCFVRRGMGLKEESGSGDGNGTVWPVRAKFSVIACGIVAAGALAVGIPRIRTDIRAVEFIEPGHPVRESLELLNTDLGGTNIFQVWIDTGRPRGLQTPGSLQYMENLRDFAYTLEGVTDAYAYSQLYIALNQIWEGDVSSSGELPDSPMKLTLFSNLIHTSPLLFKDSFVDADASRALLILRSRDMPAGEYISMLETFMERARETRPEGVTLEPVEGLHTILEGDRRIVKNQSRTLYLSLGIIFLLLAALWRSIPPALAVLGANVPALAAIFGVMGFSGYPLNSITVMVAAVILGIAVDDGIHLVSAFRTARKRGLDIRSAVSGALRDKLRPMACTSSILAVFLGLLVFTSFPPVAHFGVLSAMGIAAAFLGAVALLPALLSLENSYKDGFRGEGRSPRLTFHGKS